MTAGPSCVMVSTQSELAALATQVERWPAAVVDVETTMANSPHLPTSQLLGVGLAAVDGRDFYFVPGAGHPESPPLDLTPLWLALARIALINHTIKFDLHVMCAAGMIYADLPLYDVKVQGRLMVGKEHPQLGLEPMASKYLKYVYTADKRMRRKLIEMPLIDVGRYCAGEDVYCAQQLYHFFKENLGERELKIFVEQEVPLTSTLFRMERTGWRFDHEYLRWLTGDEDSYGGRLGELVDDLKAQVGG